jgi:hypothetical protein
MKRFLLALLLIITASAPARGEDTVEEARRYFEAGKQAYENGQYLVAATAFEEAFRLSPRPPVMFSMAQAYRRQYFVDRDPAKLKRALDLYKQYIVEVPQGGRRDDAVQYIGELEPMLARIEEEQKKKGMGPVQAMTPAASDATQIMVSSRTKGATASLDGDKPGEVPMIREVKPGKHTIAVSADGYFPEEVEGVAVEGRLVVVEVNLKEQPAKLQVRGTDGAEVSVDGRPIGTVPFARAVELPAGRHFIAVAKRGHHPMTREVQLKRGQELSIDAPLERTSQRAISYWVFGAGGLALIGGGISTGLAYSHQSKAQDVLDQRGQGQITQDQLDEYNRQRDKRDEAVSASYVMYGSAAVLVATGALLYFVDNPRVEAPPPGMGAVAPVAGAGYVGAVWSGTF